MRRGRRIIVLSLILVLLVAGAVLIGNQIRKSSQAPTGTKAGDPCCGGNWSCMEWSCTDPNVKQQWCVNNGFGCYIPEAGNPAGGRCGSGGECGNVTPARCPDNSANVAWCATFNCPCGDTDNDGECKLTDRNATVSYGTTACGSPSSGCGQVDFYRGGTAGVDWDEFCGYTNLNLSCSCDTTPPPTTPPPTPTCPYPNLRVKVSDADDETVPQNEVTITLGKQFKAAGYKSASTAASNILDGATIRAIGAGLNETRQNGPNVWMKPTRVGIVNVAITYPNCTTDTAIVNVIAAQAVTCYRCTASQSDGNTCEAFQPSGNSCPAGTSTTPSGCANAAGGQCPVTVQPYCGDAKCNNGELCERTTTNGTTYRQCLANNNGAPTGPLVPSCTFTGNNACLQLPPPPAGEQSLTVIKNADGICTEDGDHIINYEVTITNNGTVQATDVTAQDVISDVPEDSVVTNISNSGSATDGAVSAGMKDITISWTGLGPIAAGDSITLTYTLTIPDADNSSVSTVGNQVTVTYDQSDPKQVSYANEQDMMCNESTGGGLPSTGLEDYTMYYVAFGLFILAVFAYKNKYGNEFFVQAIGNLNLTAKFKDSMDWLVDHSVLVEKKGKKTYEKKLLKPQGLHKKRKHK